MTGQIEFLWYEIKPFVFIVIAVASLISAENIVGIVCGGLLLLSCTIILKRRSSFRKPYKGESRSLGLLAAHNKNASY